MSRHIELQRRIDGTERAIRHWIAQKHIFMTPDHRVRSDTAAKVLGVTAASLRNMRSRRQGPPYVKIAGIVWYRISDLAEHIETGLVPTLGHVARLAKNI